MTATPLFVHRASIARTPTRRPVAQRLSLRTRSTPGRLRHAKTRMAMGFQAGRQLPRACHSAQNAVE